MGMKLRVKHLEGARHTIEHALDGPIISIGSDKSATLCLRNAGIASEQAVIIMVDDALPLLINRAPGTKLNGESLAREAQRPLANKDQIQLAAYLIEFISHETEISTAPPADDTPQPLQSFEQVLNKLRTEDDSFYFLLEGDTRLPIDGTNVEKLLGWGPTRLLTFDSAQVTASCALIRKDWSGVLIEAAGNCRITINEQLLLGAQRLRNRDRIALAMPERSPANLAQIVFCEPASLAVLDSILGREDLPLPVTNDLLGNPPDAAEVAAGPSSSAPPFTREYFGAFTLFRAHSHGLRHAHRCCTDLPAA
ncbi:MAG: FHA domain-containing protein [Pyrinomonadaceae bacterium]